MIEAEARAPRRSARNRVASNSVAAVRFAPLRLASVRSALPSVAPTRRALGRLARDRSAPASVAKSRSAPARLAPRRSARYRVAPFRTAPLRLAPLSAAPLRSAPSRFASVQSGRHAGVARALGAAAIDISVSINVPMKRFIMFSPVHLCGASMSGVGGSKQYSQAGPQPALQFVAMVRTERCSPADHALGRGGKPAPLILAVQRCGPVRRRRRAMPCRTGGRRGGSSRRTARGGGDRE